MPRVAAYLREQQIEAGPASQRYMAIAQDRLPNDAALVTPNSTAFRQLQNIDIQQAEIDRAMAEQEVRSNSEYRVVRIKLHGVPVPLEVNIQDLRYALGLPSYSLRPLFRTPPNIGTPDPINNVEDDDHVDEEMQGVDQE